MKSSKGNYTGTRDGTFAWFQWQPGDPHDPNPPLVVESAAAPPVAGPRFRSRAGMMAAVLAAWSVVTVAPLFASVVLAHTNAPTVAHPSRQAEPASVIQSLHPEPAWDAQTTRKLVQPFVAPTVNNPPFSSRHNYAGDWPALDWRHQSRAEMVPGSEISDPPFSGEKYRGEWPAITWDYQARPKLIAGSERNDPIPSQRKYAGEWPALSWDAQQRPRGIPSTPAPVDAPVPFSRVSLYGALSNHYAPPTVTPLWISTLTSEGAPVTPVDDPPFQMRSRQDQPVELHWMPRTLTAIGLARYAESVDNPPPTEPRYRGEWPEITWSTQKRPTLIQPGSAATVNDPPFSGKKYRGEWPEPTWETQARPKLVPIAPVVVTDPPFSSAKYRGEWPAGTWETQRARALPVSVTAVPVNDPPPYTPWALAGPLSHHYAPPNISPLYSATLTSEGSSPAQVDDPPFAMRHRQMQHVAQAWTPRALTGISLARYVESVDAPPVRGERYRGEWPTLTWDAQSRQHLPIIPPAVVNNPPFGLRGDRIYPRYAEFWEPPPHYRWRMVVVTESGAPPVGDGAVVWRPTWTPRRRG